MMTAIRDFDLDLNLAKQANVPVLITAPQDFALKVARVITAQQGKTPVLKVCAAATLPDVVRKASPAPGPDADESVLVISDVHMLSEVGQAAMLRALDDPRRIGCCRIVATSPVSLYELVRGGAFSSELFYRLNVIHIRGGSPSDWASLSTHYGSDWKGW